MLARIFFSLLAICIPTYAVPSSITLNPSGSNNFANLVGKAYFRIANNSNEVTKFEIQVLDKDYMPIDLSLWRSNLSDFKDGDKIFLYGNTSVDFQLQFRERGKYLVCALEKSSIKKRHCIKIIY